MSKQLWVVGSWANPLIVPDTDFEIMAKYVREVLGMKVFDNKADHDNAIANLKGENK